MAKDIIHVDGMSCEHCVNAITKAVSALPGVSGVDVNLSGGTVTADYDSTQITLEIIKAEIEEQGYDIIA